MSGTKTKETVNIKPMSLAEFRPKEATFKLNSTGDEIYTLRKFKVDDVAWLQTNFIGKVDPMTALTLGNDVEFTEIVKMIYRQFNQENRAKFPAKEIEEYDDDGVLKKYLLKGPESFARVVDIADINAMIKALGETWGQSMPDIEVDQKKTM